jgi:hypothetical protein
VDDSSSTRPDPLRASASWAHGRRRRSVGSTRFVSADSDDSDLEVVFGDPGADADADVDAFHDPDPWGDAEATVSWSPGRIEPGSAGFQVGRRSSGHEGSNRGGGAGRSTSGNRRVGGRKSRLPKMAEERFGQR